MSVDSAVLVGSEALIRWNMPGQAAPVSPAEFIPLAEISGLINPLGQWVITETCRQLRAWMDAGYNALPVSINLSAIQFQQAGLVEQVVQALSQYQVAPALLVIEITESCFALEEKLVLEQLNQLTAMGVTIAIDDFGTGYSNMHSLRTMPLESIKIDRSFILGVESDHRDRAIYRAMVAMAKNLDLRVVAEGVETKAQYEFLQSINCDEVQGYYFFKPMAAAQFENMLRKVPQQRQRNDSKPLHLVRY
jgi:EAL domain-containing protein (putative c-di-GMP-specific phosphodiesterase class I)